MVRAALAVLKIPPAYLEEVTAHLELKIRKIHVFGAVVAAEMRPRADSWANTRAHGPPTAPPQGWFPRASVSFVLQPNPKST